MATDKKYNKDDEKGELLAAEEEPKYPPISLGRILSMGGKIRFPIYTIGGIATVINGATMPGFTIIFGKIFTAFYGSPDQIKQQVAMYALWFLGIGVASFILSLTQNYTFTLMGEIISRNTRSAYFRALLKQETGFYDQNSTGKITAKLSSGIVLIQAGGAEKFGQAINFSSQFFVAVGVALYYGWKLTLVLLSVTPVLAIVGGIQTKLMATGTQKSQEVYVNAGQTAEEVMSGVRTVKSFTNEQKEVKRYENQLHVVYKFGKKKKLLLLDSVLHSQTLLFSVSMR